MSTRFDVALALRQIGVVVIADSTPILMLGAVLVTLPALLASILTPGHSVGTVLAVIAGLGAALFATLVSFGTTARLTGKPLGPSDYFRRGIVASPPGFSVALLLGAAGVAAAIVRLVAGGGSLAGLLALGAAIGGAVIVLPALPLAIAERRPPFLALRDAGRLTRGNRGRLLALLVVAALAVGPAALLIGGPGGTDPGSGRLWLWLLFELIAASVLATIPAVVDAQLRLRVVSTD